MISSGAVPAEEALDKLTSGMQKGTDGVNGVTKATEGMGQAMKSGTLTGGLDGLNSAWRSFALNLLGVNPTLKETDEGFDESNKRIQQIISTLGVVNTALPKLAVMFSGVTDAIGRFLDYLIGTETYTDEFTGNIMYTGGVLTKFLKKLEESPEIFTKVGNAILGIAVASPVLIILGKAIGLV